MSTYLICPRCGRRGVYLRQSNVPGEAAWCCKYNLYGCGWNTLTTGNTRVDIRGRSDLVAANPGRGL